MRRFYLKKNATIVWYPGPELLLILLLILLLTLLELANGCIGGGRGRGGHRDHCTQDSSCQEEFDCHPFLNECACRNFHTSGITLFYDKKHKKCFSAVGKLCTLEDVEDGLWKIECVPNAHCERLAGNGKGWSVSNAVFGICKCNSGFGETEDHICVSKSAVKDKDTAMEEALEEEDLVSWEDIEIMTLPKGGNKTPNKSQKMKLSSFIPSSKNRNNILPNLKTTTKTKLPSTDQKDDPNQNILLDRYTLENWVPYTARSGSVAHDNMGRLVRFVCFVIAVFNNY